jgi:mRNA-degrading endonuclease HigB of HigAB toxin-antitoxin module
MIKQVSRIRSVLPYQLTIKASKSNVFINLSDPSGQILVSKSPGLILKDNVTKTEYDRVSSTLAKRKKKSLREYTNTKKRTKQAAYHVLKIFFLALKKFKFELRQNFLIINLKGSKLRIVSYLASVIVQRKNLPFKI